MPGPKMGPRPEDFNEELIRKAPTFQKWLKLEPGRELTYACRQFVKGGIDDEERLMRRIMIARRNNLKDHAVLKKARAIESVKRGVLPGHAGSMLQEKGEETNDHVQEVESLEGNDDSQMMDDMPTVPPLPSNPSGTKRRRVAGTLQPTDEEILMEMDVPAVEATRSYRRWLALPEGTFFTYNQTYTKGKDDHDWLLKKNIWRRMRYRRENQIKVIEMNNEGGVSTTGDWSTYANTSVDVSIAANEEEEALVSRAVVDAAAAAAAQVEAFEPGIDADAVAALGANDPIVSSALDAAAQLAAAAVADAPTNVALDENVVGDDDEDMEQVEVAIQV
eukprot:CAMPEP_0172307212 /NCGR_PEP_ID=MMETSP1058-20130122/8112_1 /TAXON_ID=83371 /ORGANISM="Detonula confervacea, Strain CCMP 353" /LENGTH=333 /DNA_ID=CAMNT_0013019313 /DNA_START=141 /DNA_END=1142 /DNA_ORIENTATION=-